MYCKNCGRLLQPGDKFCSGCGAKVEIPQAEQIKPEVKSEEKPVRHSFQRENFNWDLQGYPTQNKKTDAIDFNWDSVMEEKQRRAYEERTPVGKPQTKPKEDLMFEKAPEKPEVPEVHEETTEEKPANIEEELFGKSDIRDVPEPTRIFDEDAKSGRIDNFYTFNKKNEEFQALLDQEYDRLNKSSGYDEDEKTDAEEEDEPFVPPFRKQDTPINTAADENKSGEQLESAVAAAADAAAETIELKASEQPAAAAEPETEETMPAETSPEQAEMHESAETQAKAEEPETSEEPKHVEPKKKEKKGFFARHFHSIDKGLDEFTRTETFDNPEAAAEEKEKESETAPDDGEPPHVPFEVVGFSKPETPKCYDAPVTQAEEVKTAEPASETLMPDTIEPAAEVLTEDAAEPAAEAATAETVEPEAEVLMTEAEMQEAEEPAALSRDTIRVVGFSGPAVPFGYEVLKEEENQETEPAESTEVPQEAKAAPEDGSQQNPPSGSGQTADQQQAESAEQEPEHKLTFVDVFADDDSADEEHKKNIPLRIIAAILIIMVIAEAALIGIQVFAKDTPLAEKLSDSYFNILNIIKGQDDADSSGTAAEQAEPVSEINQLILDESDKNTNIKSVVSDTGMAFDTESDYGFSGVDDSEKFANNAWYSDSNGNTVYFGQAVVGAVIGYYSSWVDKANGTNDDVLDYLEKGTDLYNEVADFTGDSGVSYGIEKLSIGEIRMDDTGFYVLTKAEKVRNDTNKIDIERSCIYLEPVGKSMKIAGIEII